jgi:hypothetical protein
MESRHWTRLALGIALLLGTVGAVPAEEIVHFSNGTQMPIRSHEVKDGMVHVDLGSNGFMAFPEYMIDRIDQAGQELKLKASTNGGKIENAGPVTIPSGPLGSAAGQRRRAQVQQRPTTVEKTNVVYDKGVASARPFAGANNPANKRGISVTGNTELLGREPQRNSGNGGFRGATPVGGSFRIGNTGPRGINGKPPVSTMSRSFTNNNTPTPPAGGENPDSGNDEANPQDSGSED